MAINALLQQEARGHVDYNAAVEFVTECRSTAADLRQIAAFGDLRAQLTNQLAALPTSGDPVLDELRSQLVVIWRELVSKDAEYKAWAEQRPSSCPRLDKPSTSQASKDRRRAWRDSWQSLVNDHPEWDLTLVPLLVDGGVDGSGSYLLL